MWKFRFSSSHPRCSRTAQQRSKTTPSTLRKGPSHFLLQTESFATLVVRVHNRSNEPPESSAAPTTHPPQPTPQHRPRPLQTLRLLRRPSTCPSPSHSAGRDARSRTQHHRSRRRLITRSARRSKRSKAVALVPFRCPRRASSIEEYSD